MAFTSHSPDGLRRSANNVSAIWLMRFLIIELGSVLGCIEFSFGLQLSIAPITHASTPDVLQLPRSYYRGCLFPPLALPSKTP